MSVSGLLFVGGREREGIAYVGGRVKACFISNARSSLSPYIPMHSQPVPSTADLRSDGS